jgi:hypothetical protein
MDQDEQHLKILAICHFVLAGVLVLFSLAVLLYFGIVGVVLLNVPTPRLAPGEPGPAIFGYALIGIGLALAVVAWGLAGCLIAAGRCLRAARNRVFCIVVAAILCCLQAPGVLLGVFTLIVLMRPRNETVSASPERGFSRDSGEKITRRIEAPKPMALPHARSGSGVR